MQNANELVMGDGLSQYFQACKKSNVAPDAHVTLQLLNMCPVLKLQGHVLKENEAVALMGGLDGNHHVQGTLSLPCVCVLYLVSWSSTPPRPLPRTRMLTYFVSPKPTHVRMLIYLNGKHDVEG